MKLIDQHNNNVFIWGTKPQRSSVLLQLQAGRRGIAAERRAARRRSESWPGEGFPEPL